MRTVWASGVLLSLCHAWVDHYVASLAGHQELIIDIDATDDPTHGRQQLSMFNGYHGRWMYNELFFHDGQTGQIIVPVLRPGNSHTSKCYIRRKGSPNILTVLTSRTS
ncbi:MAG: transposase [Cytophagales bacterium]|nr:transposase [Cytophagales bacterium]